MFDVVMPLYNKEQFVAAAIESVLAQSYRNWRLFVVDDGSSDRSADLVGCYHDHRVALMQQGNKGVGPARNTGIDAGTAEWIAFLDADDVWNAGHLEELIALRSSFPDAVLIGCGFRRFCGDKIPQKHRNRTIERRLCRYFADCARGQELLVTSSAAVRRSAIREVGGFQDLPGNEDVELWARLALHGPVAVSSKQTVNYRVHTGGITDKGMAGRSSAPKPTRREELSSTIPTLDRALPEISDQLLRSEIIAYTDSRIGIRLTAAVLEGDFDYARRLLRLLERKPLGQARTAAAIARLPLPAAKAVLAIGRCGKRLLALI